MSEKKTASVVIDGKTYTEDQLNDQQKMMVNHVADLDRKLASARFNVDQLQVGRDAFFNMLKQSLEQGNETSAPAKDAA
jgi:alpha-N-acetylglucosamine transferase